MGMQFIFKKRFSASIVHVRFEAFPQTLQKSAQEPSSQHCRGFSQFFQHNVAAMKSVTYSHEEDVSPS